MELNVQQMHAATYAGPARHVMVIAGAGCGKTRTIIARVAHLIARDTSASRILVMTFTNRAARELHTRLKSEVGEISQAIEAGTFHAFCLRIMSRLPKSFGIMGSHIIDADDQGSLMALARSEHLKRLEGPKRSFPSADQLLSFYSYSRNTLISPEQYLKTLTDLAEEQIALSLEIFCSYQTMKEERGYLDYDDLLIRFDSALSEKPKLRNAVCTLFDEILVDEMQDTNPIQFNILRHFSTEKVRLFCVGDPAQSIYRFRGAEFRHMLDFQETFGESETFRLDMNYRSCQEILDFSNWLLHRSPLTYPTNLEAERGVGHASVRVEDFEHQADECSWIADQLIAYTEQRIPLSEIMVLYRTAYEARMLEAELIRRGIAYRFIGGIVLTRSAHVRDVLSLLRLARNRSDDLAWMRYLRLWPRVGEKSAARIIGIIADKATDARGVIEVLRQILGTDHPCATALDQCVRTFASASDCVRSACAHLRPVLSQRYDLWQQRAKDLDLLEQVARNYRTTSQFIDDFTLEPMSDTQIANEHNDDAVTLITVHSAKGTESRICFVASATQSNYPHFRSLGNIDAEEEERRVLYVACTRAKDELIITRSAMNRNAFWVARSPAVGEPYFLQELPAHLVSRTLHGWSESAPKGISALKDIY